MLINDTKEISTYSGFFSQLPYDWANHIELEDLYLTDEEVLGYDGTPCNDIKLYYYDVVVARTRHGDVDDDLYEELIDYISAHIVDNYSIYVEPEVKDRATEKTIGTQRDGLLRHLSEIKSMLNGFTSVEAYDLYDEIAELENELKELEVEPAADNICRTGGEYLDELLKDDEPCYNNYKEGSILERDGHALRVLEDNQGRRYLKYV